MRTKTQVSICLWRLLIQLWSCWLDLSQWNHSVYLEDCWTLNSCNICFSYSLNKPLMRQMKQKKHQRNHRRRHSKVSSLLIELLLKSPPIRPYFDISSCLPEQPGHVQFLSVPIDISHSAAKTDDAYDFNSHFKWALPSLSGGHAELELSAYTNMLT